MRLAQRPGPGGLRPFHSRPLQRNWHSTTLAVRLLLRDAPGGPQPPPPAALTGDDNGGPYLDEHDDPRPFSPRRWRNVTQWFQQNNHTSVSRVRIPVDDRRIRRT